MDEDKKNRKEKKNRHMRPDLEQGKKFEIDTVPIDIELHNSIPATSERKLDGPDISEVQKKSKPGVHLIKDVASGAIVDFKIYRQKKNELEEER